MRASAHLPASFLLLGCIALANAERSVYWGGQSFTRCCNKALEAQKLNTSEYVCGQRFIEGVEKEPAPEIWVTLKWCMTECLSLIHI